MNDSRIVAVALLALAAPMGCADTEGDGNLVTETRAVPAPFDGIVVRNGLLAEVMVTPGASQSIEVTIDSNLRDNLGVRVLSGVLVIHTDDAAPSTRPIVRVTTDAFVSASANGDGSTVIATGVSITDPDGVFSVGASEGAAVEVSGACTNLIAISTDQSTVRATGLICERGTLDALDEALLEVHLSERAVVRASGGAMIRITGSPAEVEQDVAEDVTVTVE